jgi:hypothetical protein
VIEPLRSLRARFPNDLFVHLRYQDAIKERGVEGHLQGLFEEYLALRIEHPDDPFYLYLYGRALEGRTTLQAVSAMEEVLRLEPGFAPAHRTLAGIYATARFHDGEKEQAARAKFREACPRTIISPQPPPLPEPGDLSKAQQLLGQDDPGDQVADLVHKALQQDQWRLQKIRPFDWYTFEEQRRVAFEAQANQWKGWSLLVRHYRAIHQDSKAQQQLFEMQERFQRIRGERDPDLLWTAATALVGLYTEAKQPDAVRETLKKMETVLLAKPDRKRSAQLAKLKSQCSSR